MFLFCFLFCFVLFIFFVCCFVWFFLLFVVFVLFVVWLRLGSFQPTLPVDLSNFVNGVPFPVSQIIFYCASSSNHFFWVKIWISYEYQPCRNKIGSDEKEVIDWLWHKKKLWSPSMFHWVVILLLRHLYANDIGETKYDEFMLSSADCYTYP